MLEELKKKLFGRHGKNIAQRYIALNGFDGILTVLGITVGAFSTQVDSPAILISSCLGTAIGLLVSGISGAYITEKAQRLRDFKELQKAMIDDLKDSVQEKDVERESVFISILNGLSPFSFALIAVIPYWFAQFGLMNMINTAYYSSMGLSALLLAVLGGYLGKIAKESIPIYAVKMVGVGGVTALLMYLLGLSGL